MVSQLQWKSDFAFLSTAAVSALALTKAITEGHLTTSRSYSQFQGLTSVLTTLLGLIATVWGIGLAVLIIGAPVALAFNAILRVARIAFGSN